MVDGVGNSWVSEKREAVYRLRISRGQSVSNERQQVLPIGFVFWGEGEKGLVSGWR
jgi:hypothetical protein